MMKNLYENLKKVDFIYMHNTVLEKLERELFNTNIFDNIWQIQKKMNLLGEEQRQNIQQVLSLCNEAVSTIEKVGIQTLDILSGGLASSIKYSAQQKKILQETIV